MQSTAPDFGFLSRTYKMSAILGVVGLFVLSATAKLGILAGWTIGVLLGIAGLKAKECIARCFISSLKKEKRYPYGPFIFTNYIVTGLTLYLVIRFQFANLVALMAGFTLVLFVIVTKAIGWHYFVRSGTNKVTE